MCGFEFAICHLIRHSHGATQHPSVINKMKKKKN